MNIGSQFQRFQSMAIWPHHFGDFGVWDTREGGGRVEKSCSAHGCQEAEKESVLGQSCTDRLLSAFYFPSKDPFCGLCCPYSGWVFLLSPCLLCQSPWCLSVQASWQLRLTTTDHSSEILPLSRDLLYSWYVFHYVFYLISIVCQAWDCFVNSSFLCFYV